MTPSERKELKEAMLQKMEQLKKDIVDLEELTKPIAPENSIGRVSRMDAINNRSVSEAALRQSRNKLAKLDNAISKVDNPNFGKCSRCGQPIPIKRIMYMPESTRCVNCADL